MERYKKGMSQKIEIEQYRIVEVTTKRQLLPTNTNRSEASRTLTTCVSYTLSLFLSSFSLILSGPSDSGCHPQNNTTANSMAPTTRCVAEIQNTRSERREARKLRKVWKAQEVPHFIWDKYLDQGENIRR